MWIALNKTVKHMCNSPDLSSFGLFQEGLHVSHCWEGADGFLLYQYSWAVRLCSHSFLLLTDERSCSRAVGGIWWHFPQFSRVLGSVGRKILAFLHFSVLEAHRVGLPDASHAASRNLQGSLSSLVTTLPWIKAITDHMVTGPSHTCPSLSKQQAGDGHSWTQTTLASFNHFFLLFLALCLHRGTSIFQSCL